MLLLWLCGVAVVVVSDGEGGVMNRVWYGWGCLPCASLLLVSEEHFTDERGGCDFSKGVVWKTERERQEDKKQSWWEGRELGESDDDF